MSQGWATIELGGRCRLNIVLKISPQTGNRTILSKTYIQNDSNIFN